MPETCSYVHRDARAIAVCGAPAVVLVWRSTLPTWNPYAPAHADHWRPMCRWHADVNGQTAAGFAAVDADGMETIIRPIGWGRPDPAATH